jgi:hypothetical protein
VVKFARLLEDMLAYTEGKDGEKLTADYINTTLSELHGCLRGLYEALQIAKSYAKWESGEMA